MCPEDYFEYDDDMYTSASKLARRSLQAALHNQMQVAEVELHGADWDCLSIPSMIKINDASLFVWFCVHEACCTLVYIHAIFHCGVCTWTFEHAEGHTVVDLTLFCLRLCERGSWLVYIFPN